MSTPAVDWMGLPTQGRTIDDWDTGDQPSRRGISSEAGVHANRRLEWATVQKTGQFSGEKAKSLSKKRLKRQLYDWSVSSYDDASKKVNVGDLNVQNTVSFTVPKTAICHYDYRPIYMAPFDCPKRTTEVDVTDTLKDEFTELADTWYRETRMLSFVRQKATHPAYQKIVGMGKDALPFIFRELQQHGGDWLWALEAISRTNPASGITRFKDAVAAWLEWGKKQGYVQ